MKIETFVKDNWHIVVAFCIFIAGYATTGYRVQAVETKNNELKETLNEYIKSRQDKDEEVIQTLSTLKEQNRNIEKSIESINQKIK